MSERRYEISVLIGPCSQEDAERIMLAVHAVAETEGGFPGTALNYWDEDENEPRDHLPSVDVL